MDFRQSRNRISCLGLGGMPLTSRFSRLQDRSHRSNFLREGQLSKK